MITASPPAPSPTPAGPCAAGALASISDRPGLGRSPATNGAACVALPGTIVVEAGYRNQTTVGSGTQELSTFPNLIVRIGIGVDNEIVLAPPLLRSQRDGENPSSGFAPATGMQDAGIGVKHLLHDNAWMQDALNLFVTLPTGYPSNGSGFSAGLPTYTFGYSIVFALSSRIGLSTTNNLVINAAPNSAATPQRFVMYQPSAGLSYALSPNATLLLEDQLSSPNGPGSTAGNRALAGVQCTISPNVVLDAELESNLTPYPNRTQRAIDAGITTLL